MTNPVAITQLAEQFMQNATALRQIAAGLAQIAKAMESGTLSGISAATGVGAAPTDQQMPDVLRDRQMLNTVQMSDKLAELSNELKLLAAPETATLSRYTLPVTALEGKTAPAAPSLHDVFTLFTPYLPADLISAGALAGLRNLLGQLPADLSRSLLLEHRLKADEPQVDVSILIDPTLDQGRELLAGALSPTQRDHWAWRRVQDFCAAWRDPASPLASALESCWLEFDVPIPADLHAAVPESFVPSPFFRLKDASGEQAAAAIEAGLALLKPEVGSWAQVGRCLTALPADGKVRWAGVMLSRAEHRVRLCLDLPPSAIKSYLLGLGWVGNEDQLDLLVTGFTKLTDLMVLAIELTADGILPAIGFECRYKFNRQPEIEPRWRWLTETLVKAQLCTAEKAAALLRWNGLHYRESAHWPLPQVLVRNQSHIKLQFDPGVAVTAKAYLSCNLRDFKAARRPATPGSRK